MTSLAGARHVVTDARDPSLRTARESARSGSRARSSRPRKAARRAACTKATAESGAGAAQPLPVSSAGFTHPHGVAVGRGPAASSPRMAASHGGARARVLGPSASGLRPGACAVPRPRAQTWGDAGAAVSAWRVAWAGGSEASVAERRPSLALVSFANESRGEGAAGSDPPETRGSQTKDTPRRALGLSALAGGVCPGLSEEAASAPSNL